MRVISGKYKGRKLEGFDIDGTRPTMDRVKESMFATIQNYVKESRVLDLFAGSGALGIEALSNGAKSCLFVDVNPKVINILKKNTLNMDDVTIMMSNYADALIKCHQKKEQFDLILLDPPYHLNLINGVIDLIYQYDLLASGGIIVCEYETEEVKTDKYEQIKCKKLANKCLVVYKRVK